MFWMMMRPGQRAICYASDATSAGGGVEAQAGAEATAASADAATAWLNDERINDEQRSWLSAKGLNNSVDPLEAVSKLVGIGQSADRRFGRGMDSVIDKPGKDQSMTEWRKANAEVFGLPTDATGYEIKKPDGLSEGVSWNDDLAGRMQALAFDRGLAPDDVSAMTEMYADYVGGVSERIDADMKAAETRLQDDLQKLWGKDTEANTVKARSAASALAEAAGMDQAGVQAVVGLLSGGSPGETLAIRMFAALGDMMSDDKAVGLKSGVGGLGMSVQEANAELQRFMSPDGEWAKASMKGDTEAISRLRPQYERLARAASKGS